MPQQLKYLGVPIFMNGKNYYMPSLSTRDFRAHEQSLLKNIEGETVSQQFERFIPIIGLAVRRNYPEVTDEMLEEWLDMHTFKLAIKIMQDVSGVVPVSEGE